ncbi:hypothetical protein [Paenibacillus whitsoniae]|uniref:Uncharacterized protein n=1 Tax=Paenibacillus whitsoniae TaxID=2496558 RepID=A0A430JA14_9BACL|nr:hypothetical protein [Paenibacillus whitsoniae]RTE07891.1 hypothetical protein EJQ19_19775 [Paenibacillus whitsoniae]
MDHELKEVFRAVLKEELVPIIQRLDNIETRLENVEARLEKVEARLENVEVRLDKVEARLDNLEVRFDSVELEQSQMKQAIMETNEAVKRIEKNQEQQQQLIELLSYRSIEQEAKLKRVSSL